MYLWRTRKASNYKIQNSVCQNRSSTKKIKKKLWLYSDVRTKILEMERDSASFDKKFSRRLLTN